MEVPGINAEGGVVKPVANAAHMLLLPGWAVAIKVLGRDELHTWVGALVASGVSVAAYMALFLALNGVRRVFCRALEHAHAADDASVGLGRRRFLVNAAAVSTVAVPAAALGRSTMHVPWNLQVRRYRIPIAGLPVALDGIRIVQVSDTHLGPRVPAAFIRDAVDQAVALQPDCFVITGDYVHDGARHIDEAVDLFKPLVAAAGSLGVIGTLGNHDWYADGPRISAALTEIGVHMVDNDRVFIDAATRRIVPDAPAAGLCVGGFGDLMTDAVDVDAALRDVPIDMPRIVLSHHPDCAELADVRGRRGGLKADAPGRDAAVRERRIDLMVSGHTHGGQIRLPILGPVMVPSAYFKKYEGGHVQGPAFPVVISRGVGMSILPVRWGVPPELVEMTLVRATESVD